MTSARTPGIVGGYFNVIPEDTVHSPLNEFMLDARTTATVTEEKGTFNAFGRQKEPNVIDHIFYRGRRIKCTEYHILDGDYGAPFISDHYPIEIVLEL